MSSQADQSPQLPVFLYGSLRHSQENYMLLRGYTVHEEPARVDHLNLYAIGHQPVAVPGEHAVIGEIAAINPLVYAEILRQLDDFEGWLANRTESLFKRGRCMAITQGGTAVEAWIYTSHASLLPRNARWIASGDWVGYLADQLETTRYGRYLRALAASTSTNAMKGAGNKPHASE